MIKIYFVKNSDYYQLLFFFHFCIIGKTCYRFIKYILLSVPKLDITKRSIIEDKSKSGKQN